MLEEHTTQSGTLPGSVEEVLLLDRSVTSGEYFWSTDSESIVGLVRPDFSVSPTIGNLSSFAPSYKANASWAWSDCEFYWELIVESCSELP